VSHIHDSDGAEQMGNGIMDVNEVHPAMLEHHERESGEVVLNKGRTERLGYLADRHHRVTTGRCMYCEQEGGKPKVMPPIAPHSPAKKEKRKRSLSSSDASECTTSNQRRQRSRYEDDEEDDDEKLPEIKDQPVEEDVKGKSPTVSGIPAPELLQDTPVDDEDNDDEGVPLNIKDEPTDEGPVYKEPTVPKPTAPEPFQATSAGDEDEDAGIAVKIEPMDVDATTHGMASSKATVPELQQDTSFDVHPHRHITKGVANMGLKDKVGAHDKQSEDHELHSLDTHASEAPEPESLAASARTLKETLLNHISEWAKSATIFKLDLTKPAGELYLAVEVSQITIASKIILQHMTSYCEDVGNTRTALQQELDKARAKGMPVNFVHAQEGLVRKYRDKEVDLRAVTEKINAAS
jgi:hypothetical protein